MPFPLDLPTTEWFTNLQWRMLRATSVQRSPFTGKRQALAQPFALWACQFTLAALEEADAIAWQAFLIELEGQAGTFKMPVFPYSGPRSGYAGAAGVVQGAGQLGTSLVTDGWSNSVPILNHGDWFTINDELKMVKGNKSSNGSGQATIDFMPPLRTSPADNAALNITSPYAVMSPVSDDLGWAITPPVMVGPIQLQAIEAF